MINGKSNNKNKKKLKISQIIFNNNKQVFSPSKKMKHNLLEHGALSLDKSKSKYRSPSLFSNNLNKSGHTKMSTNISKIPMLLEREEYELNNEKPKVVVNPFHKHRTNINILKTKLIRPLTGIYHYSKGQFPYVMTEINNHELNTFKPFSLAFEYLKENSERYNNLDDFINKDKIKKRITNKFYTFQRNKMTFTKSFIPEVSDTYGDIKSKNCVIKMNKYLQECTKTEFDFVNQPFRLVKPENMSNQFTLGNNENLQVNEILREVANKKPPSQMKEVKSETLEKINNTIIKEKRKKILNKMRTCILKAAEEFKQKGMDITYFYNKFTGNRGNKFMEGGETYELLRLIKIKDMDNVADMIKRKNYLLWNYDDMGQTPLHYAVKRNFYQIIHQMVKYECRINAYDIIGRTPLHHAVISENFMSMVALMYELANPFLKDKSNKKPIDYAKNDKFRLTLEQYMKLQYCSWFGKVDNLKETIRKRLLFFINNSLHIEVEKNEFCIG